MPEAYASIVIDAPVEAVWPLVRDFSALPSWVPGLGPCTIEDGRDADSVGCVRAFTLAGGTPVRERLLMLDDCRYTFAYDFQTPAFPVENYRATFELIPLTKGERTFAQWRATFDEPPQERGKYVEIVSRDVFAAGLRQLAGLAAGQRAPAGASRWQGLRPAKVFCASVIGAGIERVWPKLRDFAGMEGWHPDVQAMRMLDGARPDKVSGIREFLIGGNRLHEQLTLLCDTTHAFRYRILMSANPWLNYHAGVRLRPVTATGETFAVWTADWVADPNDDVRLIPSIHDDVFQLAFDTLDRQFRSARQLPSAT